MHRRTSSAVLAATTLATLAACADSKGVIEPTASTAFSASRSPEFNSPGRHEFHTRDQFARDDASNGAARSASTTGAGISFHGGTVLQKGTNVVAIYWGSATYPVGYLSLPSAIQGQGSADPSLLGTFLSNFSNLTDHSNLKYFNINSSYYDNTGAHIAPTVAYTSYWNTANDAGAPTPGASPTDAQMIALVNWGLDHSRINYDPSTIYAIFTGSGVNLGGGFGSQYCAYHTHGTVNGVTVTVNNGKLFFYAAMPYNQQYPSGCTSGFKSPNADVAANSEVNTLAHEIEETTTDDMGNAWYDSRGYENGDKCAWTWGTMNTGTSGSSTSATWNQSVTTSGGTYHFLVQQNWLVASTGHCTTGF